VLVAPLEDVLHLLIGGTHRFLKHLAWMYF